MSSKGGQPGPQCAIRKLHEILKRCSLGGSWGMPLGGLTWFSWDLWTDHSHQHLEMGHCSAVPLSSVGRD